jgi:hypothetical protein
MTDKTKKTEDEVTKAGAVELDEKDLGDVAGGGSSSLPMESLSLNYSKIEYDTVKPDSSLTGYKITDGTSNTVLKR